MRTRIRRNRVFRMLLILMLSMTLLAQAQEHTEKVVKMMFVTDIKGEITELTKYGIVYRPFASNNIGNAFLDGIIVKKGEGGEIFKWENVVSVTIVDMKHATIEFTDGNLIENVELQQGTLVGTTPRGGNFFLDLLKVKTIQINPKEAKFNN